jgi:regulator of protease activity HflC (stomatin/prohibitin superfamily)
MKHDFKKYRPITIIIILLVLIFSSVGIVRAGERGVRLRFGAVTGDVLDEGLYFKIPLVERVVRMDVRIQKDEVSADAASKDLQDVSSVVALNYHLAPQGVADLYQNVRQEYKSRLVAPALQEAVKASTAQFTAEELITRRPEVREDIIEVLKEKFEPHGITVDAFNIIDFEFSEAFNRAIEDKVTAEQESLAAQNRLEKVKFEAQQRIEDAKGKAEAIRIEADALARNPAIIDLRAIEKWDGILPKVTGGAVPFIDIDT